MTTQPYRFPEERTESTGAGPDFPDSAGDRERGKFRPSSIPRRTTLAVAGDDGKPVTLTLQQIMAEMLLWQKAIVLALVWSSEGEGFSVDDVLNEASRL